MAYPDNVLSEDEQVVLHRHPHWKRLASPVLMLIITTGLASFGLGVVAQTTWDHTAKNVIQSVIGVIWLIVVGWFTV